QCLSP
ncbi:hypothetical protein D046_1796B, partial [Vibrio parahaemolyticus V-223/04]